MAAGISRQKRPRVHDQPISGYQAMSHTPYTVESATSLEQVYCLQQDWDRVSASAGSPNVFTTFDWYAAWYRHLADRAGAKRLQPYVLTLKRDGIICGIAPLTRAVVSRFGIRLRRLQFAGREHEWDYNDLVTGDDLDGKVEALAKHLSLTKRDWELVDLMDVRDTDNFSAHIQSAVERAGLRCALFPAEERCPYMPIDGSWEQMLNRRSSATRHSFRNRQSKLRKIAGEGLRLRILDAPHTEPGLLERMIALEAQKRSGGVLSVPFLGRHVEVFESVFSRLGAKGWLCVALLEREDRLLSWHLLFRCGGKLWGYMTAYDHEFGRLSPGSMLIPEIVDYGFAHGVTEYDFLAGEEPYKMQWAKSFHQRYRVLIWHGGWKSRLYATLFQRLSIPHVERSKKKEPQGSAPSDPN